MKRLCILVICLLLLTGCASGGQTEGGVTQPSTPQPPTSQTTQNPGSTGTTGTICHTGTTAPQPVTFTLYQTNEPLDGYDRTEVTIEKLDPQLILQAMQDAGVLNQDVRILSLTIEDGQLNLDMNQAFMTQLCSLGALTEGLLMGSVVNTFLSAYTECDSMMVTVDGGIICSGHVDYDFPMNRSE